MRKSNSFVQLKEKQENGTIYAKEQFAVIFRLE